MTATIIESDTDTGFDEFVSEQLDDAIPCDRKECEAEAEYKIKFHCCRNVTMVCEDHMFWIYGEIKQMFRLSNAVGLSLWLCFHCDAPHGSLQCFKAVPLKP